MLYEVITGKAIAVKADISDKAQIGAALERIRGELGPVTILVNNAAIENFCPILEIEEDNWDRIMDVITSYSIHYTKLYE